MLKSFKSQPDEVMNLSNCYGLPLSKKSHFALSLLGKVENFHRYINMIVDFFISIKMISHITFMLRSFDFVILSLLIPKKVTITKIHHLIRLNFERSEHKKSQCDYSSWLKIFVKTREIKVGINFR